MADRDIAVYHLRRLLLALEDYEKDLAGLTSIVAKAQNDPPLGEGDGTLRDGLMGPVTNTEWTAARDAVSHFRHAIFSAKLLVRPK